MATMDVRIKVTADIMEDSDNFCERADTISNVKEKANIFSKAKVFKKRCLARTVNTVLEESSSHKIIAEEARIL